MRWEDRLAALIPAPTPIGAGSVGAVLAPVAFWTHHAAAHHAAIRTGRTPTAVE